MYIENHGTLQPEVLSARCPQCFNVSGFMFVQHLWPKMGFTPGHFITEHDDKRWDFDGFWGCPIFRHTHVCFRFKVTSLWWSSLICSNECTWMWYGCFTPWIGGFHDKPTISFFSMLFVSSTILDIGPQYSLMMFNGRRWYNDVVMIWLGLKQAVHHLYTHIYTHTHIYIYAYMFICTHTYIYIYTHAHTHIYIYTYLRMHTRWIQSMDARGEEKCCSMKGYGFSLSRGTNEKSCTWFKQETERIGLTLPGYLLAI
jgi:hypothetical protein